MITPLKSGVVLLIIAGLVTQLAGARVMEAASGALAPIWHAQPAGVQQSASSAPDEGELIKLRDQYWQGRRGNVTFKDLQHARQLASALPKASRLPASTGGVVASRPAVRGGGYHRPVTNTASATQWTAIGPGPETNLDTPWSGRVSALAADPTAPNTLYLGGANGGVWKTTNGGVQWTALTDNQDSLAIGSIAIDPNAHTTIYAGTGEPNGSGDSYYGSGVLKSTDGGSTWALLGTSFFGDRQQSIFKVAVDPNNSQHVFAATNGGLAVSQDGGTSWGYVSCVGCPPTGKNVWDLVLTGSTNPSTMYAAVSDNGVYKSADGGSTWAKLTNGPPMGAANVNDRTVLAIAPSNPSTLYSVTIKNSTNSDVYLPGSYNGGYYTTDSGASWHPMASLNVDFTNSQDNGSGYSQGWYDIWLAVDPLNDKVVYGGGLNIAMTTNAQASSGNWTDISSGLVHTDHHAVAFPSSCAGSPCPFYFGEDGGVFKYSPGANGSAGTFTPENTAGLNIAEYVGGALGPNFTDAVSGNVRAMGGTQDNGTQSYGGSSTWPLVYYGDGGHTAVDWTNPNNVYTENYGSYWAYARDGGKAGFDSSFTSSCPVPGCPSNQSLFYAPYALDQKSTSHLAWGGVRVYESINNGHSWYASSPSMSYYNSAIAIAPSSSSTVYMGTAGNGNGGGEIWRTTSGDSGSSTTWTRMNDGSGLGHRWINGIAVDPTDPNTLYAATGIFYYGKVGHIFKSIDGGSTWTDISGALPQYPINTVVEYPSGKSRTVVIGTDYGVYYTTNDGGTWWQMNNGLPKVAVTSLALDGAGTTIAAFTHGRSVYTTSIATPHFTVSAPSNATGGSQFQITVKPVSALGDVNTDYIGTVHFTSSDAQATLPGDYTFTGADNGSKTFNITLASSGPQTISVTDTADGAMTGTSTSVSVSPPVDTTLQVTTSAASTAAGSPVDITVAAVSNGATLTTYTGTVHFTSTDNQAGLPQDYTFTQGDAGTHTFTAGGVLKTVGSQTISATDTSFSSIIGTSLGVNVSPGPAHGFTLSTLSAGNPVSSAIAGVALDLTVTAIDAYNNVVPNYTGTVHFTSIDSGAVLPADYTFLGADSGSHMFTGGVVFKGAGQQTVTATDTTSQAITGTSPQVTVKPGPATTLTVTGPTQATAGTPFDVAVTMLDAFGNTATGYTGTVGFTSTDTKAVLPQSYTFVGGDAGTHTFTGGVTLKTVGGFTVSAKDTVTSTIAGTSSSIPVVAGPAATFTVVTPSLATAGTPFDVALTTLDAFGNTATGYTGKVHFSSTDTHATLPSDYTFAPADSGVHTFTSGVTFSAVGNWKVTAADTATSSIKGTSNAVPVFGKPGAPALALAIPGDHSVSLNWAPPVQSGIPAGSGGTLSYTWTCTPNCGTGKVNGTSTMVSGLTNGVATTFTLTATNSAGLTGNAVTLTVKPTPTAARYGDFFSLTAAAADPTGKKPSLTLSGDTGAGPLFTDNGDGTGTFAGFVTSPVHSFTELVTAKSGTNSPVSGGFVFTVTRESAFVRLAPTNAHALRVIAGTHTAPAFNLGATVSPSDIKNHGSIGHAAPITFTLTVGNAVPPKATCVAASPTVNGTTETATCSFPKGLAPGVYHVRASIGGNYYMGAGDSVLTVIDPTRPGVQGGGSVALPNGASLTFGIYGAKTTSMVGQFYGVYCSTAACTPAGTSIFSAPALSSLLITTPATGTSRSATIGVKGTGVLNGAPHFNSTFTFKDSDARGLATAPDTFGMQTTNSANKPVVSLTFNPANLRDGDILIAAK